MADAQDVETTPGTATQADVHYQAVSGKVPPWLLKTSPKWRQALRKTVPQSLPWLSEGGARLPQVLQALDEEHQRHRLHVRMVAGFLGQLPSVEAFAEPLLREALKKTFGLDLDVRKTFLFNAVRARASEAHLADNDPVVRAFQVVKVATRSLLQAALQNFEAFEAEPDGLRDDRRPSRIFASESGLALEPGRDIELVPERFAALCRTLDLGERYQRQIREMFQPTPVADESAEAAALNRQAYFKLFEQSSLRLNLHMARLRGWIDQHAYQTLLEASSNGKGVAGVECSVITLWELELNGAVLFSLAAQGPSAACLVLYLPDEPQQPVQVFATLQALNRSLCERLRDNTWRTYFLRFVPARERDRLLQRIQRTLFPKVWNPGGWYEEQADRNALLQLDRTAFTTPLLDLLLQRKMAVLKDDGLYHAVPTATQDHKSLEDKITYCLSVGFNVLNVAAFIVPGLGQMMLVVNAALLGYEVYEGFDSLSKGDREEAWGYFMDVGENLALIAALGAAGAAAQRFSGNLPLAVRSMRPVTLADGRVRLWTPDLKPFAYDVRLPTDLKPGENGLYAWQGRQWLALDGRYYSVRTLLGEETVYRLEHPTRPGAYEPEVRHNGNGGWLHELDTPEQWSGLELFRRQGFREADVSADMAQRALRSSGVSEGQLRQSLVDRSRPPALLTDTLRRLVLADRLSAAGALDAGTFTAEYQASQADLSAQAQVLRRDFDLPHAVIEEILAAADKPELDELTYHARVPLRLAEEARLYQQQVRIARACEGLYLGLPLGADSACLVLHGLESLPQWPANLRIDLHEGSLGGRLLASIGSDETAEVALVWREQAAVDFFQTLFDSLPEKVRSGQGVSDAAALREKLRQQPLAPRHRLRQWLGLQSHKPGYRSPMRLADGRLGYPLSGQGTPFITEDELLDKLRLLELDDIHPEDALQRLYSHGLDRIAINTRLNVWLDELLVLRRCMDRWSLASANEIMGEARQVSRERIGHAIWDHWRRSILPELGRPAPRLIFWQVQLADLPAEMPPFFRERVRDLLLDEVIQTEGERHERIIGAQHLTALARQFPNLTALDIRAGEWGVGLTETIAGAWPRLMSLGLREQTLQIGHRSLRSLLALTRLRRLSLRGSRLGDIPSTTFHGLILDYLGLDAVGLREWPVWLDNTALGRIGELSLEGNHLTEVPPLILADITPVARPLRIALQGNIFGHQALIDLTIAERFHRRFIFDLDLSPAVMDVLNQRVTERASLLTALQRWADPALQTEVLSPEHLQYRQRILRLLMGFWREDLRGPGMALLCLDDVVLADFPDDLPAFFIERVRRLDLTRYHAGPGAGSLERFVCRFRQLRELSLISGQPSLGSVPAFLSTLPELRELALVRMGMTIDQTAMEAFARLPLLSSLQLDGNVMGQVSDMSMFADRFLGFLGLAQMGIATWPAWLSEMLPNGIELLCLDDNQLTELPAHILENRRTDSGAVEIALHNNPLTRETLIAAHTSQHHSRPYSFALDLPEDIAVMGREVHDSDTDEPEVSVEDPALSDDDPATTWETGDVAQDERNQGLWDNLVAAGDANALLGLVGRLRYSADYRSTATRAELVQRVWSVLAAAMDDGELRQMLDGMAQEPLQQANTHETCPDGIRLEFNQMEGQVYTRQALRNLPETDRASALYRLMRSLFRAQALDSIARRHTNGRDEAEVRLAYRLRWAQELELPLPPRGMLYRGAANIAPGELNMALALLQMEEAGPGFFTFAGQCDFWTAYLREAFEGQFRALKDSYEAEVLRITDAYPDESAEQTAGRIRVLEDRFKGEEQALITVLTLQHGYAE